MQWIIAWFRADNAHRMRRPATTRSTLSDTGIYPSADAPLSKAALPSGFRGCPQVSRVMRGPRHRQSAVIDQIGIGARRPAKTFCRSGLF